MGNGEGLHEQVDTFQKRVGLENIMQHRQLAIRFKFQTISFLCLISKLKKEADKASKIYLTRLSNYECVVNQERLKVSTL